MYIYYRLHFLILLKIQLSHLIFNFVQFSYPITLLRNCTINSQLCSIQNYIVLKVLNRSNLKETNGTIELNKVITKKDIFMLTCIVHWSLDPLISYIASHMYLYPYTSYIKIKKEIEQLYCSKAYSLEVGNMYIYIHLFSVCT